MIYVFAILILIAVICDALRDKYSITHVNCNWWAWHGFKWVSFFMPYFIIGYILIKHKYITTTQLIIAAFVVICSISWRIVYNIIKHGESHGKSNH